MADNVGVRPSTTTGSVSVATDEINDVHYPIYKVAWGADGIANPASHDYPFPVADFWLDHAVHVIESNYGDVVSIEQKNKDLLKFGHNSLVGTTQATIAHQPAGILHETYVSSNLITSIISDDNGDTQDIVIEGHTSTDGLSFTFVTQTATLTGQTAVTLTTPLARVSRFYNDNSTDLAGTVYITEDDTYTAGVPDTDIKCHLQTGSTENQSEKCSTTMSSVDYWIVTSFSGDMLKKSAAFAEIELQVRLPGKVFRPVDIISCTDGGRGRQDFKPYIIVPKNADVRLAALANASSTPIAGSIQGVLATIVT